MLKRIVSIILGLAAAVVVIMIVEAISHILFPVAPIDMNNKEAIKQFMADLPVGAMVMVLTAWIMGSFFGAITSTLINKENGLRNSITVGIIILVLSVLNLIMLPSPVWMWVGALTLIVPAAWAGHKLLIEFRK